MSERFQELMDKYQAITSQPLEYADGIPDLMKYENFDVEYLASNDDHFQDLDKMPPLGRAALGAEEWNRWVQWAQLIHERWVIHTDKDGCVHVGWKAKNNDGLIDFSTHKQMRQDSNGKTYYNVSYSNFSSFVFPCIVLFKSAIFSDHACFDKAFFCLEVDFSDVEFRKAAHFNKVMFSADTKFLGATFLAEASFNNSLFNGETHIAKTTFDKDVFFEGVIFRKDVWLEKSIFESVAKFTGTVFLCEAAFQQTTFKNSFSGQFTTFFQAAHWDGMNVMEDASFSNSQFLAASSFNNTKFQANTDFDHVWFGQTIKTSEPEQSIKWPDDIKSTYTRTLVTATSQTVPDFKGTIFEVAPNLGYTEVAELPLVGGRTLWLKVKRFFGGGIKQFRVADADAASKLRVLGSLANRGHHHLAEKRFFRAELLCRRGHEATSWREVTMINLFELFSGCGLSFWKPIGWWAAVSGLFAVLYAFQSGITDFTVDDWLHLFNYTLANSTPVLGVIKSGDTAAAKVLFDDIPPLVSLCSGIHNLISTIFLFFGLLAIRNYFKLG